MAHSAVWDHPTISGVFSIEKIGIQRSQHSALKYLSVTFDVLNCFQQNKVFWV